LIRKGNKTTNIYLLQPHEKETSQFLMKIDKYFETKKSRICNAKYLNPDIAVISPRAVGWVEQRETQLTKLFSNEIDR
jgi:hypothetical protein